MRRVYLDHAATTPLHPAVVEAMLPYLRERFGNASSVHAWGREAREAVEAAREQVARLIGAQPDEITFTSGATESDNLAILGVAREQREARGRDHVITSAIEHHAVLHACEALQHEGFTVTVLSVDHYGLVDPDDLRRAITPRTALVTIMYANNEVGTIEPVTEIGRLCREAGVLFHTDAVQAAGHIPCRVDQLYCDLLSLTAHKMYGPMGTGALYVRRGVRLRPLQYGGGHEFGRRPGTENVAGIVGLGKAAELAAAEMAAEAERQRALRDRFIAQVFEQISDVRLNGHPVKRLPNNINLSFAGVEGESLLLNLDLAGIACSTGSACSSGTTEPSHVLQALGVPYEVIRGSLRFTLGRDTTADDLDYTLETLVEVVGRLRALSPLTASA
jgi:cysteine desulfurase